MAPSNFPTRGFQQQVGVLLAGRYLLCRARKIGEEFLMVQSEVALPEGALALLTIPIDASHLIITRARVTQTKTSGPIFKVDFELMNCEFNDRRLIRSYVANKIAL